MPKETIRRLDENAGRVLVAGAHLAAADPELGNDKAALERLASQLGDRAPVIGQLAQALGKVATAGRKDVARELVTLATSVAQVRAAQASLASAPGEPQPLPATAGALGTPCNARDIYDLEDALVTSGSGRMEKVDAAIERGDVADLRLVDALVQAMGDGYLGEKITKEVVPLLGAAISGPIRRRFNPKGRGHDARRLRALVSVEKAAAKDVIVAGLREGNSDIREVAFDALADHVPGLPELEPVILEVVAKERGQGVRRAATRALAGYGSDAAFEALIAALDSEVTRDAAAEALGRSTHPKAVDRLLELLDATLREPEPKPQKKASPKKAAPKKAVKAPAKSPKQESLERARAILTALGPHKDPRIAERALELVESHGAPAASCVVTSGNAQALERVADLLDEKDAQVFAPAVAAAVKLGADAAWKRLTAAFKAKDSGKGVGLARVNAVLEALGPDADKRWGKFLLDLAKGETGKLAETVIETIGRLGDSSAVKPLVTLLDKTKTPGVRAALLEALGALKATDAVDSVLEIAKSSGDYRVLYAAQRALRSMADVSTVQKVRDLIEEAASRRSDYWRSWHLRHLLDDLLERFPGQ